MADKLFFRKGTLKDLQTADKIAGSINFTTDEPAIYLDVEVDGGEVERRRIGDIIQFEYLSEFTNYVTEHNNDIPQSALYYIEKKKDETDSTKDITINALLKWNGTNYLQLNEKNDFSGDLSAINGRLDTLEGQSNDVAELKTAVEGIQTLLGSDGEGEGEDTSIISRITALETTLNGSGADDDKGLASTVEELNTAVADAKGQAETNAGLIESISKQITTINTSLDGKVNSGTFSTTIDGINTTIGGHTESIGKNTQNISSLSGRVESVEGQVNGLSGTLSAEIDAKIKAANAMNYIGSLTVDEDGNVKWPSGDIHAGDTYVAADQFTYGNTIVNAGDLLVANGTENSDGIIPNDSISWDIVKTGYQEAHDGHLSANNDKIQLLNYSGATSSVTITGSENIAISTASSQDAINISMEWGTFT